MNIRILICITIMLTTIVLANTFAFSGESADSYIVKIKQLSDNDSEKLNIIESLQNSPILLRQKVARAILPLYSSETVPLTSYRLDKILVPLINVLDPAQEDDRQILISITKQKKLPRYQTRHLAAVKLLQSFPEYITAKTDETMAKYLLSFIYYDPGQMQEKTVDQEKIALSGAAISLLEKMPPSILPIIDQEINILPKHKTNQFPKNEKEQRLMVLERIKNWIQTGQEKLTPKQRQALLKEEFNRQFADMVKAGKLPDNNTHIDIEGLILDSTYELLAEIQNNKVTNKGDNIDLLQEKMLVLLEFYVILILDDKQHAIDTLEESHNDQKSKKDAVKEQQYRMLKRRIMGLKTLLSEFKRLK